MSVHADARRVLDAWVAPDADQRRLRDDFLAHLAAHPAGSGAPDGTSRACRAGHLTASALVVQPGRGRVLLTQHATVGRWLQLGGHIEPHDTDLAAAALREAREESGIADLVLSPAPARLDRHGVRCRFDGSVAALDHLDVQYWAVAPDDAVESAEGAAPLGWFGYDELPPDADDAVRSLVEATRLALA